MRLWNIAVLGLAGIGGTFAIDRWIGSLVSRGEGPDPVMKMAITIGAPTVSGTKPLPAAAARYFRPVSRPPG